MKKLLILFICFALCFGTVYADGSFTAVIESADADPGDSVDIDVVLQNNPGLIAALFSLEYDRERLTLEGAKDGELLEGAVFGKSTEDYPYKMVWNSASTTNFTDDGVLVTLTFKVKDNAKGGPGFIKLGYNPNDVFDVDLNNVNVLVVDGSVKINAKSSDVSGGSGYIPPKRAEKNEETEVLFTDLDSCPWAKDAVERLARKNIIKGTGNGIFSPGSFISRADFAIMLTRALGIQPCDGEQFSDVDENKYYAAELKTAKAAGIIRGIGDNKFDPEGKISRQDMMVMIFRAMDIDSFDESADMASYSDMAEVSPYAQEAVSALVNRGVIKGSDGKINPRANTTRAEVAVVLDRLLN